jgi:hypothetical protein
MLGPPKARDQLDWMDTFGVVVAGIALLLGIVGALIVWLATR